VSSFKHRLRDKVLEIVIFKGVDGFPGRRVGETARA
jgi:hypothetical protein